MRVLEIGCGVGRIILQMSEIFGEVIGIDVSGKMVEITLCSLGQSLGILIRIHLLKWEKGLFCYLYH